MSEIPKCQSCKGDFDSQDKIPMILPCAHNVCYECANDQYRNNRFIKCDLQSCQKVHQIRSSQLQEDSKTLKNLEQKMFQEIISKLREQQANLTKAQKQLSEQQSNIIYKLMKHLNDYVLKDNIALQKEIKKINKNIKHQLNYYQQNQQKMNQNVKTQNIMQQSSMSYQTEKTSKFLIDEAQQIIVKLSKITINVYEDLEISKTMLNKVTQENASLQQNLTEYNKQIQELKIEMQKNNKSKASPLQKEQTNQEALECFAKEHQLNPQLEIPQIRSINQSIQDLNQITLEDIWQLLQQNGAGQDDRSQIRIWNYKEIIPNNQFLNKLPILGEGGYGTVYLLNIKGSDYALKVMNQKRDQQKLIDAFYLECKSLLQVNNLRVDKLLGVSVDTSVEGNYCFCLLTDYMSKGSLYQVIQSQQLLVDFQFGSPIRFFRKLNLLSQIAEGLQAIHSRNLIHRDMKSLNILLDDSDSPKITDFGLMHDSSVKTTKEQKGSIQ